MPVRQINATEYDRAKTERNFGLSARPNMSTMTDSAKTARGGSSNQPNSAIYAIPPLFRSSVFRRSA